MRYFGEAVFLSVVILVILSSLSTVGCENWIVPDEDLCRDRPHSVCHTLENYLKVNSSIFSTHDSTWTFHSGTHYVKYNLEIVNAVNVTLRGEDACRQYPKNCTLILETTVQTDGENLYQDMVRLNFVSSNWITISSLYLTTSAPKVKTVDRARNESVVEVLRFNSVSNVTVSEVVIQYSEWFYDQGLNFNPPSVIVVDPSGSYVVTNCFIQGVYSVNFNINECKSSKDHPFFSLDMSHTVLDTFGQFEISVHPNATCSSIEVDISHCSFSNGESFDFPSLVSLKVFKPLGMFSFTLDNSLFHNNTALTHPTLLLDLAWLVQNIDSKDGLHSVCNDAPIQITNCIFKNNTGGVDITVYTQDKVHSVDSPHIQVLMKNTSFIGNLVNNNYILHVQRLDCDVSGDSRVYSISFPLVCLNGVTFGNNSHRPEWQTVANVDGIVRFSNFQEFPVYFSGKNEISFNSGCGLELTKTMVLISDVTDVFYNSGKLPNSCGGVHMSPGSKLLIDNNSKLNISSNRAPTMGGGIRISPTSLGYSVYPGDSSLDTCFFMPFDLRHPVIPEQFGGRILLNDNYAPAGRDLYSSLRLNCKDSPLGQLNNSMLKRIVKPKVWNAVTVSSAPLYICVCNRSNASSMDCGLMNKYIHDRIHPGQSWRLLVTVMGIFDHFLSSDVFVNVSKGQQDPIHRKTNSCTEVLSLTPSLLQHVGTSLWYPIKLTVPLKYPDSAIFGVRGFLKRFVYVNLTVTACPPGFTTHTEGNKTYCACNRLLSEHGFICDMSDSVVKYKSTNPNYWISMMESDDSIILSDYCPPKFCTSVLSEVGVTLEDLKMKDDKQCVFGRGGLLCSIKHGCVGQLYPQLFVLVFACAVIVSAMFFLELTLRKGTIIGFSLYSNILVLLTEHRMLKQLGVVASFMNLEFNLGACLFSAFDGYVDEWTFFQLFFPLLGLMGLEVVIILIALAIHCCCGSRVSSLSFVKEKALPVLGTTAFLTFSNVIRAIISSFSTTTTYGETMNTAVRWVHIPHYLFFQGKHLSLGIISIVLIVVYILPFVLIVLTADCIRVTYKSRVGSVIDTFRGPFRGRYGFWLGIRVIFRIIVTIIGHFASGLALGVFVFVSISFLIFLQLLFKPFRNVESDTLESHEMSRTSVCSMKAVLYDFAKKFFHPRTLDHLFLINMVIATIPIIVGASQAAILTVFSISVILALLQLLGILVYHFFHYFSLSAVQRCVKHASNSMRFSELMNAESESTGTKDNDSLNQIGDVDNTETLSLKDTLLVETSSETP